MEMASNTRRTKSLISSLSQTSILGGDLHDFGCDAINENELSDAVPRSNHKRLINVQILEDHLDLSGVVRIDDARQGIQTMLHGQSRSRAHLTISSGWELN